MGWPNWLTKENVEFVKNIGLLGLLGLLGKRLWNWSGRWILFKFKNIPRKTLLIMPPERTWWHLGGIADQPAMQVVVDCQVTNISDRRITIVQALLKDPRGLGLVTLNGVPGIDVTEGRFISPGATVRVGLHFMVQPVLKKENEPFKTNFCLTDQFLNEHCSKKITFSYI